MDEEQKWSEYNITDINTLLQSLSSLFTKEKMIFKQNRNSIEKKIIKKTHKTKKKVGIRGQWYQSVVGGGGRSFDIRWI